MTVGSSGSMGREQASRILTSRQVSPNTGVASMDHEQIILHHLISRWITSQVAGVLLVLVQIGHELAAWHDDGQPQLRPR